MKLLLLLLLPIFAYSQGGNTCVQALAAPLPFNSPISTNTCGQGNDFSTLLPCMSNNPINANDYLYAIIPATNGMVTVNLTNIIVNQTFINHTMYASITAYFGCPTLGNCISHNFVIINHILTYTTSISFEATAGQTYYILVDGWRAAINWADCFAYTINATITPIPVNNGCSNDGFAQSLSGWFGSQGLALRNTVGQPIPFYNPTVGTIGAPRITVAPTFSDVCLPFAVTSPLGGNFVRLGRQVINREANRISYRYTVTMASSSFTYAFLPVLQDPVHLAHEQPFFEAMVILPNGTQIPCSRYIVSASQGLAGYVTSTLCTSPAVIYRPWSLVNIDLSDYIGQTVTVQFTSGGCSQSAHWGYTYVDYQCSQSPFVETDYSICIGSCLTLPQPLGYASYVWNPSQTVCPLVDIEPTLNLVSANGCIRTINFDVNVKPLPNLNLNAN